VHFPVAGIEVSPFVPPLVAFAAAFLTSPAGLSGAFLLMPYQVSALGFAGPAVSPTNLLYNIIAIPGGVYRYFREGRMAWPLVWTIAAGTLPGVFIGAAIRIRHLTDPEDFKVFVGVVLLYLGGQVLYRVFGGRRDLRLDAYARKFERQVRRARGAQPHRSAARPRVAFWRSGDGIMAGLSSGAVVKTTRFELRRCEFSFWGSKLSFDPAGLFALSLLVGVVGGIYGIGGGAIIAPICASVFGLPLYAIAGATLAGTFLTSGAGVFFYTAGVPLVAGSAAAVSPDWALGCLLGAGGLAGTYFGARLQKYVPERLIRIVLGVIMLGLALEYVGGFVRRVLVP